MRQHPTTLTYKLTIKETVMSAKSIYHLHHIVPKHMGGTDESSNLVKLTVEEHAEAHRVLWETHGKPQDYWAWQGLSGLADKAEIVRNIQSQCSTISNNTRVKNKTHNFLGDANPSRKLAQKGEHHFQKNTGNRPGDIAQRKLVETGEHHWQTEQHKKEVSKRSKVMAKELSTCPHCSKTGQKIAMGRWHFDNCPHKPS